MLDTGLRLIAYSRSITFSCLSRNAVDKVRTLALLVGQVEQLGDSVRVASSLYVLFISKDKQQNAYNGLVEK